VTAPSYDQRLQIEIDNYDQTVLGLRAFAHEILFDNLSRSLLNSATVHCGRIFLTSPNNRHSKKEKVTPDLAIQQTAAFGLIVEAKFGFAADSKEFFSRIDETVAQIEKYDDNLTGWPVGAAKTNHDLVLLVNWEDARRAVDELKARRASGKFVVSRKLAIVSIHLYTRVGGSEWLALDLEDGELSDQSKTSKLHRLPIRLVHIESNPTLGRVKIYDERPPLPTMMDLIHRAIIEHLTQEELEQFRIEDKVEKRVLVNDLIGWLGAYAFPRTDKLDPVLPEPKWVLESITSFVDLGWAERASGNEKEFTYVHKKNRKGVNNPLKRFREHCAKVREKTEAKKAKMLEKERSRDSKARERLKKRIPLLSEQFDKDFGPKDKSQG
jgi:hypothetical protein